MGIRFYCPNGCKIHVKAFQAGRRGICPHCGTSVDIPWQSTRESSRGKRRATEPKSTSAVSASAGVAETPNAGSEEANDEEEELATPPPEEGTASGQAPGDPLLISPPPLPESAPTGDAGLLHAGLAPPLTETSRPNVLGSQGLVHSPNEPDPLEDAAEVIWYVRPPTGGQYGPAGTDVVRCWLAEGRITPDSQVWREGWRDWRDAGEVFPEAAFPQFRVSDAVPGLERVLEDGDSAVTAGGHHGGGSHTSVLSQLFIIMVLIALGGGVLAAVYVWARFY